MDQDQYIRRQAYEMTGRQSMQEVDYYEFEGKIYSIKHVNKEFCIFTIIIVNVHYFQWI